MKQDPEIARLTQEVAALEGLVVLMARALQGLSPRFAEGLRLSQSRTAKIHDEIASTCAHAAAGGATQSPEFSAALERLIDQVLAGAG